MPEQSGYFIQVKGSAQAAASRIADAENHSFYPGIYQHSGTHGAGFFSDVKCEVTHAPIAIEFFQLMQEHEFSMGGYRMEFFDLISGSGDNNSIFYRYGTDGDFSGEGSFSGFDQSLCHKFGITHFSLISIRVTNIR